MNTPKIDAAIQSDPRAGNYLQKFQSSVRELETALADKHVWNSDFENIKYWLSRGSEMALDQAAEPWRELYRQGNREHYREGDPRFNIGYTTSPLHAQGFYNKLKKYQNEPAVASYLEVLAEVAQIGEMMKQVKLFIEKGRKPSPPKPDPWAGIPRADEKQLNTARSIFEALCKEMKAQALKQHIEYYTRIVQMLDANKVYDTRKEEFLSIFGPIRKTRWNENLPSEKARIAMDFMDDVDFPDGTRQGEQVAKDWEVRVQKRSKEEVEAMFAAFINKQTEKVAAIIKNRDADISGEVQGNLECELHFALSDKSQFDMRCKIVWHVNQLGTSYWQFPTTFHNAVKADGTRITPASELNMKKLF
jgi:hypothetical protein